MTQVSGGQTATYTYDALNHRVRIDSTGSSLEFIYDMQGRHSSEWNVTGSTVQEAWTYWGNAPLSYYYPSTTTTQFDHQDWLGTERTRTGVTGSVVGTYTSFPFGDGYANTGNDENSYHFAGLDQDNSGNEHAQFREYSNMAGRWFSPDPYGGSYDPTNPQSFNRYAYVLNNPLGLIDPVGLDPGDCFLTGLSGNSCSITVSGNPPGSPGGPSESGPGDPLIKKQPGGAGSNNLQQTQQQKEAQCAGIATASKSLGVASTGMAITAGGFGLGALLTVEAPPVSAGLALIGAADGLSALAVGGVGQLLDLYGNVVVGCH